MSMQTAGGRVAAAELTIHTLTSAVAAIVDGAHADAITLLITAAEGAIELDDTQLAVDILRQAQREAQRCTSR